MGRKSTKDGKSIYQELREKNDLTREKASDLIGFKHNYKMKSIALLLLSIETSVLKGLYTLNWTTSKA